MKKAKVKNILIMSLKKLNFLPNLKNEGSSFLKSDQEKFVAKQISMTGFQNKFHNHAALESKFFFRKFHINELCKTG